MQNRDIRFLPALALTAAVASANVAASETDELRAEMQALKQQLAALADAVESAPQDAHQSRVSLGGYGEMHLNLNNGDDNEIDFHRFVLFLGAELSESTRFFAELELEHSLAGDGKPGEIELEQAYLEQDIRPGMRAKAGLFLLPVGLLNETHEPETFYGVERNNVEKNIIPTTWWEGGVALTGELAPGVNYDLAMHSGLNTADGTIRKGRQKVAEATANKAAYTGRIRYTGVAGMEVGVSAQYQDDLMQGGGEREISASLIEAHVAYANDGFGLKALYAEWSLDKAVNAIRAGASKQNGFYIEPSYRMNNVGVFYRLSGWDNAAGNSSDSDYQRQDIGVNYWLAPTAVLKADYFREELADDLNATGYNLGVGYSF
ncbi:porin [Thalassolituus marinus]|uniref:Porin n=1 Tax=Thalassolituus marinus TaxID=671053 RepID=A0ABS7ZTU5_9GAMM|nr:porin [Thalassolituus marinus]MCA6065129.1 porin [Thalassolituus marinus]